VSEYTATPRLTARFDRALAYTAELHRHQTRKSGTIPYLGHLLSVAGTVIAADGTETQAIAALLHDAAEDQGGQATLAEIDARFGAEVAALVAACSDTFATPKPPWRARKEHHLRRLASAADTPDAALLVSLADKLDNARSMLRDLRAIGPRLWERFNEPDPEQHLWYYRSLLAIYTDRGAGPDATGLVAELAAVIDALAAEVAAPAAVSRREPDGTPVEQ